MALRETHVEIDFISDTSGLRDIQQQTNNVLRESQLLGNTFDNNRIRMSELSDESRSMLRMMRTDWQAQRDSMNKYRDELIRVRYGYHLLAKNSDEYAGATGRYIRRIQQMGNIHKRINDEMLANDLRRKAQFIENIGAMMNRTSRAKRIMDTYKELGNPIYRLANGTLRVADGLDRMAMAARPAAIALKMLGPTASMKQLQDRTKQIQQGLGALPLIMMGAAFANFFLMRALHRGATETVPGYARAFELMGERVRKAFQPMVDVFAMIMIPIYKFITAIANMVIRFNEAHPLLARMIQGTILLAVVLTLVLAPLSLGIGLWYGYAAVFGYLWTMIKGVAFGLAAMSPIVWAIAAAVVVLTVLINKLWKENEGFRNAVISAWNAVKQKASEVFGWLVAFLAPIFAQIIGLAKTFASAISAAFTGDFSKIGELFKQLLPSIIGFLVGGLPGLLIAASRFIPTIVQGIQSQSGNIATTATKIITDFVTFIATNLPRMVEQGVQILTNIVQGIVTNLPIVMGAVMQLLTFIVSTITTLLPVLVQAGLDILMAIVNAIVTNLPMLITAVVQVLQTLLDAIITLLPVLLQAGLQIITGLLQGIVQALPMIFTAAVNILMTLINGIVTLLPTLVPIAIQIIMTLVNFITANLPLIIAAGIQLLTALINGIVQMLPLLITAAINLITQLSQALIQNLPTIINAGIQILTALINGIIQMVPQLVAAALQLIEAIVGALIENTPALLDAGVQLIMALVMGIGQMLSEAKGAALDIGSGILEALGSVDLSGIGADMMSGFLGGISSMKDSILETAGNIAESAMGVIKKVLDVNSPSRELFKIGGWTTEGMALGMEHNRPMVMQASESIAGAAMYTPAQTVASNNSTTTQSNNVTFSPVYNVTVAEGQGNAETIKQQLDAHTNDMFATLTDLFGTEVAY